MGNMMRLAFKEIMNKRVLHLGFILMMAFLTLYGTASHYLAKDIDAAMTAHNRFWMAQEAYMMLALAWYLATFLIGGLAIMTGAGSIASEVETGTIMSLASKPITRTQILAGKYLTYSAVIISFTVVLLGSVSYLTEYYFHIGFQPMDMFKGILILILLPLVLLAVAHLFSSFMSTVATGVLVFMLFALAAIAGFIEQLGAIVQNQYLINIGIITSLIFPTDAVYRLALAQAGGSIGRSVMMFLGPFGALSTPSSLMVVYVLVYTAAILFLAGTIMSRRDF